MIATTYEGLEYVLGRELMRMGAQDVDTDCCRVMFSGDKYLLYQANYELRTALKIYKEVLSFDFSSTEEFFTQFSAYRWSKILNIYKSFRIEVSSKSPLLGSDQEIKDSLTKIILEYFNEKSRKTPPHDNANPSVVIVVEISKENNCKFLLDSSGESLSRRGYKVSNSSFNVFDEVFSAGLVQLTGFKADTNFIDPLSKGGIMLIEASMFAYNIPAQVCRENFGFFSWRDFDSEMWQDIKSSAKIRIKHNGEFAFKLIGYEADEHDVKAANQNIKKAMLDKYIDIIRGDYTDIELPSGQTTALTVAPHLDSFKQEEYKQNVAMLSSLSKKTFKTSKNWIVSENNNLEKVLGIKPQKEIEIKNNKSVWVLARY